ncbi:hypothetical protein [Devosia neptuniae]|uniref:hypothetical protein n=1 Tax=Devosia TaxID=46913 RepID=UPI0022AFA244|nr:hypothetical protein [Devosia neptuniae]MCZ4344616.1 hypothetical protein [Devosia neptuniae]
MSEVEKISAVFKTTGQPTVTYVQRDSGALERRLGSYLDEAGQLCLITGPSKTGKTTLYKKVLQERGLVPLVVQCTKGRTCEDIWRLALEGVNFERVIAVQQFSEKSSSMSVEAGTKIGWHWLAEVSGKIASSVDAKESESETREKIVSQPSPDLLIPILRHTNYILVIEDFHYLDESQKILLFQQWKRFIDSEITVLILGTTHRAVDIASSNKDLIGRIAQIDVTQWDRSDLIKICQTGFDYLKITAASVVQEFIATEAVGLPILVQQVCLEAVNRKDIYTVRDSKKKKISLSVGDVKAACHQVAGGKYTVFGTHYETLIRGPREKLRKYKTYELVLACFAIDPIKFSLTRSEIDSRISRVSNSDAIKPPAASINSTLGALKQFQDKRDFELLEWRVREDKLYIVEPSFLFYVRWRRSERNQSGEQLDLFEGLLNEIADREGR